MFKTILGEKKWSLYTKTWKRLALSLLGQPTHVEFQLPFSLKSDALLQVVIRFRVCV